MSDIATDFKAVLEKRLAEIDRVWNAISEGEFPAMELTVSGLKLEIMNAQSPGYCDAVFAACDLLKREREYLVRQIDKLGEDIPPAILGGGEAGGNAALTATAARVVAIP